MTEKKIGRPKISKYDKKEQICFYVNPLLKKRIEKFCKEGKRSLSLGLEFIVENYLDGKTDTPNTSATETVPQVSKPASKNKTDQVAYWEEEFRKQQAEYVPEDDPDFF